MSALTIKTLSVSGVNAAAEAATGGGDTFANNGKTRFLMKNGHSSEQTVTVVSAGTHKGLDLSDPVIPIPAGEDWLAGPFPMKEFNDGDGNISLTYSGVTLLKISIFKDG